MAALLNRDELNALFEAARVKRRPLLDDLKGLDRAASIERLLQEPLVERLYWLGTLPNAASPAQRKAERKTIIAAATASEVEAAQNILRAMNIAASDAALRHYGYRGHEHLDWDANINRMLDEAADCPPHLTTHAFDRNLMWLR